MTQVAVLGGARYVAELLNEHGFVVQTVEAENLVPDEGLTMLRNAVFNGGAVPPAWFVGIFEGDYTPTAAITAATIAAQSLECTAYTQTTRPALAATNLGAGGVQTLVDGATDDRAKFDFGSTKTIMGAFLVSNSNKGGTAGTLLSAVRFPSPITTSASYQLRVRVIFNFISS